MFDTNLALDKIQHGFKIPPQPYVLQEISYLIDSEEFELPDLAHLIAKDMCISSDILCVVNSEVDGFNRSIADINQAVCFLGVEKVGTDQIPHFQGNRYNKPFRLNIKSGSSL